MSRMDGKKTHTHTYVESDAFLHPASSGEDPPKLTQSNKYLLPAPAFEVYLVPNNFINICLPSDLVLCRAKNNRGVIVKQGDLKEKKSSRYRLNRQVVVVVSRRTRRSKKGPLLIHTVSKT